MKGGKQLDNRYVVPYNPWLLHKYQCHINVEVCSTIASVKYLYKYVYKGHDRAVVSLEVDEDDEPENEANNTAERPQEATRSEQAQPDSGTAQRRRHRNEPRNEIQEYVDARYVSSSEACWRLFDFPLQDRSHSVVKLQVHLPDQQYVTYADNEDIADVLERCKHTTLTRFFEMCASDPKASDLLYQDTPRYYRWDNKSKKWVERKRDSKAIGRLVTTPPNTDRFFLRRVLCYRRGPKSFEDLLTVDSVQYETFMDAARAMGLLDDDREWSCMKPSRSKCRDSCGNSSLCYCCTVKLLTHASCGMSTLTT